jgi:hypothetical protein
MTSRVEVNTGTASVVKLILLANSISFSYRALRVKGARPTAPSLSRTESNSIKSAAILTGEKSVEEFHLLFWKPILKRLDTL